MPDKRLRKIELRLNTLGDAGLRADQRSSFGQLSEFNRRSKFILAKLEILQSKPKPSVRMFAVKGIHRRRIIDRNSMIKNNLRLTPEFKMLYRRIERNPFPALP